MTITEKLSVSFDPVNEHKAMIEWVKAHDMGEWKKYESTASFTFVREKTVFIEATVFSEAGETTQGCLTPLN